MAIEKRKNNSREHAIIVAVNIAGSDELDLKEELEELELLSATAGAVIIDKAIQNRNKIDPSTFIGSGKVKSIINNAKELGVTVIIFNDELINTKSLTLKKFPIFKL